MRTNKKTISERKLLVGTVVNGITIVRYYESAYHFKGKCEQGHSFCNISLTSIKNKTVSCFVCEHTKLVACAACGNDFPRRPGNTAEYCGTKCREKGRKAKYEAKQAAKKKEREAAKSPAQIVPRTTAQMMRCWRELDEAGQAQVEQLVKRHILACQRNGLSPEPKAFAEALESVRRGELQYFQDQPRQHEYYGALPQYITPKDISL